MLKQLLNREKQDMTSSLLGTNKEDMLYVRKVTDNATYGKYI